ncbi:serine acetyltransferase [Bradyrhizobium guangdongense]|uniref:serine acetyltransferase n=1 Tax=Bradyrhizobium guangdongense TaxID=1325090 RepID=UPI00112BBFA6|nr:serine acetyltransferase [Bradyrhizobium guangdongense]TPQ35494.1 serine acetyltransferase [Bradyrhizobium guangdongense]
MQLSLQRNDLASYVRKQLEHLFPDGADLVDLPKFVDLALDRVEHCFSRVRLKGFSVNGEARFSHLHSDQYAIFLYYLSNSVFRERPGHPIADKAYVLNKALHAWDAFYEVVLPDVFAVQHPVGTVLGRANYSDYFICYHNCTVGANLDNVYPSFGRGVVMYGGSRIIGQTSVGDNSFVSTGAIVIDGGMLEADSILHGIYPNARRSRTARNVVRDIFGV